MYGSLSEKQINYLRILATQIEERPAKKAQWDQEHESAPDCPTGTVEISGTILSAKEHEIGDFDCYRMVMTVKSDEGYIVWGTLPSAIYGDKRGDRIKFKCSLQQSDRDPKFGFFKRPRNASVLERNEVC